MRSSVDPLRTHITQPLGSDNVESEAACAQDLQRAKRRVNTGMCYYKYFPTKTGAEEK